MQKTVKAIFIILLAEQRATMVSYTDIVMIRLLTMIMTIHAIVQLLSQTDLAPTMNKIATCNPNIGTNTIV